MREFDEEGFNRAYERANDPEYQKRIRDLCCLKNWRAKYEILLKQPFTERNCKGCESCALPKGKIGEVRCTARLLQKISQL